MKATDKENRNDISPVPRCGRFKSESTADWLLTHVAAEFSRRRTASHAMGLENGLSLRTTVDQ